MRCFVFCSLWNQIVFRRMELVAEAAHFSAREAVKARQLARSIEDQEQ
jgi:hypothetical protein